MVVNRFGISKIGLMGFPGYISVYKIRYGYGHQEYIEKLEILDNWFSDLNAYLPVMFKGKEGEYTEPRFKIVDENGVVKCHSLYDLMSLARLDLDTAYNKYQPAFEGQSLDGTEKLFIKSLRAIKERLNVITAESKIIEGAKIDDTQEMMAG